MISSSRRSMDGYILTCSRALTDLTIGSSEFSREGTLISALPLCHRGTDYEYYFILFFIFFVLLCRRIIYM